MTYIINCGYCGVQFTAVRRRKCCTRSCSAKLKHQRMGTDWHQDAELWLEKKAGTLPLVSLTRAYNQAAKINGWPSRSQNAIKIKLNRLNLSRKCTENNITRYALARVLGVTSDKIRTWTRSGLPYRKMARNQTAIRVCDVREFLLNDPRRAYGVSEEGLAWLIGEKDAAIICEAEHSRRGYRRPVINLDTGQVYPGIKAAARETYITHNSIAQAIRRGGRSAGYRWAYVNDLEERA